MISSEKKLMKKPVQIRLINKLRIILTRNSRGGGRRLSLATFVFSSFFAGFDPRQLVLSILQLPLVSRDFAFELLIVVLEGSDKMSHFPVDWSGLLVRRQILLEFDPEHFVFAASLGERIFQLNELRSQFFLNHQLGRFHFYRV